MAQAPTKRLVSAEDVNDDDDDVVDDDDDDAHEDDDVGWVRSAALGGHSAAKRPERGALTLPQRGETATARGPGNINAMLGVKNDEKACVLCAFSPPRCQK